MKEIWISHSNVQDRYSVTRLHTMFTCGRTPVYLDQVAGQPYYLQHGGEIVSKWKATEKSVTKSMH